MIISFFKGIVADFKTLWHILKCMATGKPIVNKEKFEALKDDFKTTSWKDEFKKTAPWLMAVLFAVFIGIFLGAKYYEVQCNNFIIENYIQPQLEARPNAYGFNFSLPAGSPGVAELPQQNTEQGSYG